MRCLLVKAKLMSIKPYLACIVAYSIRIRMFEVHNVCHPSVAEYEFYLIVCH